MILDLDPESDFQPFAIPGSGLGSRKKWNHDTSHENVSERKLGRDGE